MNTQIIPGIIKPRIIFCFVRSPLLQACFQTIQVSVTKHHVSFFLKGILEPKLSRHLAEINALMQDLGLPELFKSNLQFK